MLTLALEHVVEDFQLNEVRVRRATTVDLDALVELENAAFAVERISARQMRRHLDSVSAEVFVATRARRLIGAAIVFFRRGSGVARLYSIAVAASERGQRIGETLLMAAEQSARKHGSAVMRLEVRVDNRVAQRLYERHGYHHFGSRDGYYEDGVAALRYGKRLDVAAFASDSPSFKPMRA